MNIKEELKHARKELKESYKILKDEHQIKDPKGYLDNLCGGRSEGEISYASWQRGKIDVLERIARELEVVR
jgi:hypothetical protein